MGRVGKIVNALGGYDLTPGYMEPGLCHPNHIRCTCKWRDKTPDVKVGEWFELDYERIDNPECLHHHPTVAWPMKGSSDD